MTQARNKRLMSTFLYN